MGLNLSDRASSVKDSLKVMDHLAAELECSREKLARFDSEALGARAIVYHGQSGGDRSVFLRVYGLWRFQKEHGWPRTFELVSWKMGFSSSGRGRAGYAGDTPSQSPTGLHQNVSKPYKQNIFDVVFFIGCWEGESKRYRVYNIAEFLEKRGYRVKVLPESACFEIVSEDWRAAAVVFFRTPYQAHFRIDEVIDHVHTHGGKVVFDVDDLVFEPELVNQIHGVRLLSPEKQREYRQGVERYRLMLQSCDLATVSTEPLVRAVEALGIPALVVPNSINAAQIEAALTIRQRRSERSDDYIRIGYFSGSNTHGRDFAQAEGALLEIMRLRTDVQFLLVGLLDLGPAWHRFADRVVRVPLVPPLEMLDLLGACDINIAPLEVGDPFCEAKSELKFFEAALVDTPTIASSTEPFVAAIEHGVSGMLAASSAEWAEALNRLVSDVSLRTEMGARARAAAIAKFGPDATLAAAKAALLSNVGSEARNSSSTDWSGARRLKIDWIIPRLIIGGGGHRNIIRAAHHLHTYGHDVALHFTSSDDQAKQLSSMVHDHFYPFRGEVKAYDGDFRESDVIFATHWTTVDAALRARDRTKEIMYFVQDFEPAFAPMGSEYVLAENTYRQGLYSVTSGPWCERLLRKDYGCDADHFRFPVDRDVYFPRPRIKTNPNIVFFAKPDMPRRCYEIGVMALAHFHRIMPDVEIILFGSGAIKRNSLDFPATLLEIVPTINDLSKMYANADLGLVFSTTNPSLVPYEMMASGCPVVDLDRPGNEYNYDERRDIAFLANPIPERMAAQLTDLLNRPEELADRRRKGLAFASTFPTEEEMARRVEHLIMNRMRRLALL